MKTIDEILEGCEHDGSYIPVAEVKRLMKEYAAMIFSEKVDETYQASQSPEPNTNVLKQILLVLDNYLGDTDPDIGENWTDEDIKHEEPILWVHMKLVDMISEPNTVRPRRPNQVPITLEPNTVTDSDIKAAAPHKHKMLTKEQSSNRNGFINGARWALQQTQATPTNTVTEPYHKEAIELVKKHIPNDALAKEYILESLQQTQAVGVSEMNKTFQEVYDMNPYKEAGNRDSYSVYNEGWTDACSVLEGRILELLNQKK